MSHETTPRPTRIADAAKGRAPFTHPHLLALDRGPGVLLVLDLHERDGWPRLGCRIWAYHVATETWGPTREGFSIRPSEATAFLDAVQRGTGQILERDEAERARRNIR